MRFVATCPGCGHKPRQKKLPLAIYVEGWGTTVINKTCRYCPGCDLLIAHEDELRELIDRMLAAMEPEKIGTTFFVVGTLDRSEWREGMNHRLDQHGMLAALHDFIGCDQYELTGGWMPSESANLKPK